MAYCESEIKLLKASWISKEFQRHADFDPIEKCVTIARLPVITSHLPCYDGSSDVMTDVNPVGPLGKMWRVDAKKS